MAQVPLYDKAGQRLGYVTKNDELGTGHGLIRLRREDLEFAEIFEDRAVTISKEEAVEAILRAGKEMLFKERKYADLRELYELRDETSTVIAVKRVKRSGNSFCIPLTTREMDRLGICFGDMVQISITRCDDEFENGGD